MAEHKPNEHIAPGEPGYHTAYTASGDHSAAVSVFSDAEWESFRSEDFAAGKAVVMLMLGIFSTGVIIYSIVAYWVIFFSRA
jgi:hypothetical protein